MDYDLRCQPQAQPGTCESTHAKPKVNAQVAPTTAQDLGNFGAFGGRLPNKLWSWGPQKAL